MPETYAGKQQSRVLTVLALCTFLVGFDTLVTVPLLPTMARDANIPLDLGVLLVTVYALAYVVTAPIFGAISDTVGRKSMIFFGMIVLGVGTALTGWGDSFTALLIFRAVAGVGAGMIEPSVYALVGDRFSYEERGRAMGIVTGTLIASTLFGVPLGAYVSELGTWRYTFWGIGILAAAMLVVILAGIPKDEPKAESISSPLRSVAGQFRTAFSNVSVFFALLATFLWFGGLQGMFGNAGVFYALNFGFDSAQNGLVIMVAGVGSVIGSVAGGKLADRFGKKAVIGWASVLTAGGVLGLSLMPYTGSAAAAVAVHVLWATTFGSGQTALTALISELSSAVRGTVLSLNSSAMFGGQMVATAASAALLHGLGSFLYIGILCAVAAFLVLPITFYLVKERAVEGEPGAEKPANQASTS